MFLRVLFTLLILMSLGTIGVLFFRTMPGDTGVAVAKPTPAVKT
jgi:hypothetical protein